MLGKQFYKQIEIHESNVLIVLSPILEFLSYHLHVKIKTIQLAMLINVPVHIMQRWGQLLLKVIITITIKLQFLHYHYTFWKCNHYHYHYFGNVIITITHYFWFLIPQLVLQQQNNETVNCKNRDCQQLQQQILIN